MAVRDALLVLLLGGPAYGFQLHGGLAARTGGRREINVGQTYATLERLRTQGLVEPSGTTDDGLPLHRITASGRAAAAAWLEGADAAGTDPWHETVDRVLLAVSLPSIDAGPILAGEVARWVARRDAVTPMGSDGQHAVGATGSGPSALAELAAEADVARAAAVLAWLDRVRRADVTALAFAPSADRPRRGRRPRSAAPREPQSVEP